MAVITRTNDASSLIPEDYAKGIWQDSKEISAARKIFKTKQMVRKQTRMSVLSAFPTAGFVTGAGADGSDVGLKPTTNMSWANVFLNAEPLACIVPISEDLLEDQDYPLWDEIKPSLVEAVAIALDAAVFFGTSKPSTWPTDVATAATNAGNTVTFGTGVDLAADLNNVMGAVEADGFNPTCWWARVAEKAALRGLRDANRQFLFGPEGPSESGVTVQAFQGTLFNEPMYISAGGLAGFSTYRYISLDASQFVLGLRSDIKYQMLSESTLYNPDGSVMFALAQQDMVALRLVMRVAFAVPNPVTRQNTTAATRYPAAVLHA